MKNNFISLSAAVAVMGMAVSLPAAANMSVRSIFADAALSIDAWVAKALAVVSCKLTYLSDLSYWALIFIVLMFLVVA